MDFSNKNRENRRTNSFFKSKSLSYVFIIIVIISIILFMLSGCASTLLTDSWKNPEFNTFKPQNVMIVGVTQNTTARMIYEQQLKSELNTRGLKASQSALIFDDSFKDAKQTEEDIEKQVDKLLELGYDAILISAVKGIDERVSYSEGFPNTYFYLRRFGRHYYLYQDIYFEPGYYNKYNVYHIETSIYNIKADASKSLIWVGSYDIVNPENITKTVNRYVKAVTQSLETENLIPKKNSSMKRSKNKYYDQKY